MCDGTCRARQLTDEQRAAVAAYFSVYKGQEGGLARLALSQVSAANHPALDRAYDLLRPAWVEVRARWPCPACLCCAGLDGWERSQTHAAAVHFVLLNVLRPDLLCVRCGSCCHGCAKSL